MIKDLIEIKQLPIIEEQLKNVSKEIDEKVKNATSLICTDETVKAVKELRASLNKDFREFEAKRKEVKEKVMAPYMQFENVYKEYISDKFKSADLELKQKIDSVENELKSKKEQEVRDYFEEYKVANNIDFISYEQANINVTLSASMKSLKEQAKQFIDKIVDDLKLIETQERKTEILVEYKQSLNVSYSIQLIKNRYTQIDLEEKRREELKEKLVNQITEKNESATEISRKDKNEFVVVQTKKEVTIKFNLFDEELEELEKFLKLSNIEYEREED